MDAASASSGAVALPPAAAQGRCIAWIRLPPGWKKESSPVRGRCIARVRLPPKWTPAEDARLERLAKENGFGHWHRVSRQMMTPRRSPRQCRAQWRDHIARHVYRRPCTAGDDEELRRLVARFGSSGRWKDIGRAVYGRTSRVMKRRWKELRCNKNTRSSTASRSGPPCHHLYLKRRLPPRRSRRSSDAAAARSGHDSLSLGLR